MRLGAVYGIQPPPGRSGTPSAPLNDTHPLVLPARDALPTAADTPVFVVAGPAVAVVPLVESVPAPTLLVAAVVPRAVVPMPTPLGAVVPVATPLVAAGVAVPALPVAGTNPVAVAPILLLPDTEPPAVLVAPGAADAPMPVPKNGKLTCALLGEPVVPAVVCAKP